jgi:hypothetical protein
MAVTDADILGWLNANPDADDWQIAQTMKEAGVSNAQFANVTGMNPSDADIRYASNIATAPVAKEAEKVSATGIASLPVAEQATTASVKQATQDIVDGATSAGKSSSGASASEASTAAKPTAEELIAKQLLAQNLTSKWSGAGHGSAEANAKDMAKIIAATGVTNIKDFGVVPVLAAVEDTGDRKYNGQYASVQYNRDGTKTYGTYKDMGEIDEEGNPRGTFVPVPKDAKLETVYGIYDSSGEGGYNYVDSSKLKTVDGKLVADTGQTTYGNKATGQTVASTYGERQTGNAFGGTFEGKGNTGYRVQFAPDGTPIFYTTGASSNDFAQLMSDLGPIGNIALAAIGGPMAVAAMGVLSGKDPGDILKSAALAYLGTEAGSFVSGTEGITDLLGDVGTNVASNVAKQYVGSGGKGVDPLKLLLGSGLVSGDGGGPNSSDFIEGYFNEGGEGYNILNSDTTDEYLKSIGINSIDELTDSGLSNADILSLVNGDFGNLTGLEGLASVDDDFPSTYTGDEDANGGGDGEDTQGNTSGGTGGGSGGGGGGGGGGGSTTTAKTTGSNVATTTGGNVASTTNPVIKTTPATVTPTTPPPRKIVDVFPRTTTTTPTPKISNVAKTVAGLVSGVKGAKAVLPTAKASANPAVDAITGLADQQQTQQGALLNLMSGKDELANIKSYKELYGSGLFGDGYVPPSAGGSEEQDSEEEFFNGGHVNDLSIDALLHMLRN